MRQSRRHPFLASFLLVFALSCGSGGDFNLISVEEEWQLGAQLARDIERQMQVINDPYIDQLGRRLVAQTNMANLPWQFHLVNNPEINAFAIPGGHVYIHTGLVNAADNASELAGVMAHEIAHIVARHSTEQISRQYGLSALASVVLGQNPAAYQALLAQIIAGGALARFSRDAENEADALAIPMMTQAGYNPRGMVTMFQELLSNRRARPNAVDQFFSTHPLTEDRIRNVERRIGNTAASNLTTDEAAFRSLKSRV